MAEFDCPGFGTTLRHRHLRRGDLKKYQEKSKRGRVCRSVPRGLATIHGINPGRCGPRLWARVNTEMPKPPRSLVGRSVPRHPHHEIERDADGESGQQKFSIKEA